MVNNYQRIPYTAQYRIPMEMRAHEKDMSLLPLERERRAWGEESKMLIRVARSEEARPQKED